MSAQTGRGKDVVAYGLVVGLKTRTGSLIRQEEDGLCYYHVGTGSF